MLLGYIEPDHLLRTAAQQSILQLHHIRRGRRHRGGDLPLPVVYGLLGHINGSPRPMIEADSCRQRQQDPANHSSLRGRVVQICESTSKPQARVNDMKFMTEMPGSYPYSWQVTYPGSSGTWGSLYVSLVQ